MRIRYNLTTMNNSHQFTTYTSITLILSEKSKVFRNQKILEIQSVFTKVLNENDELNLTKHQFSYVILEQFQCPLGNKYRFFVCVFLRL